MAPNERRIALWLSGVSILCFSSVLPIPGHCFWFAIPAGAGISPFAPRWAHRARLWRQILVESAAISLAAMAAAVVLAY